jgi:hypothetical protein
MQRPRGENSLDIEIAADYVSAQVDARICDASPSFFPLFIAAHLVFSKEQPDPRFGRRSPTS